MLLIHCALHAEARPFIQHLQLKRRHDIKNYACFCSDDVTLIESGTGKLNAAAATAWLGAISAAEYPVCINIGIAGHADRQLGCLVACQRIEDAASGKRWYPPRLAKNLPQGENLLTLDQPADSYPPDAAVDMEASGFMVAATRFSTLELIHSLKVISDNRDNPPGRMKTSQVEQLIAPQLENCMAVARDLLALREVLTHQTSTTDIKKYLQNWHFSQYQKSQLARLLQRHSAILGREPEWDANFKTLKSARAVIAELTRRIDHAPVTF
jgi:nucleoside phosphorylase